VAPILEKLGVLDEHNEFSHIRAVALALETLGDRAAAEPLAELLADKRRIYGHRMSGHAITRLEDAQRWASRGSRDSVMRMVALREIILARALYRCGDHEGLGEKVLREYASDLRGHLARHAQAVLKQGRGPSPPPPVNAPL
jgi:hypothetical protein